MNGYLLSRQYFDWAFEHPNENNPTMTALYFFIVEINNRLGWKEEFTITPRECLEGIGVSSYNTYKKNFDKLVELGFIKIVKPSKNQYQANIISLSIYDNSHNKADNKALDNALNNSSDIADEKHATTQVHSTVQPTCDIHKTTNNKHNKESIGEKPKRFLPPSLDEVIDFYMDPSGFNLTPSDAEYRANRFIDFYASNGWKVGKNKMVDWKASARKCVREWDDKRQKNISNTYTHPAANYTGGGSSSIVAKFNKG